jgi:hypothetical protein
MSYKPGKKCSSEIARDLSVEACVEGSLQRVGERVQLSIQLVHGRTNRRLWASHYAGDTRGLPRLLYQIACDLVGHMKVGLAADQQAKLAKVRTLNPEAYDAYLAGRYSLRKRTEAGTAEAQKYFFRAIDIDPGFAPAYCQLALMYSHGST